MYISSFIAVILIYRTLLFSIRPLACWRSLLFTNAFKWLIKCFILCSHGKFTFWHAFLCLPSLLRQMFVASLFLFRVQLIWLLIVQHAICFPNLCGIHHLPGWWLVSEGFVVRNSTCHVHLSGGLLPATVGYLPLFLWHLLLVCMLLVKLTYQGD